MELDVITSTREVHNLEIAMSEPLKIDIVSDVV